MQARYYSHNKMQWKLGIIIKKFGQLHYLIKLDDGYIFKRHIDQLCRTNVQKKRLSNNVPVIQDNFQEKFQRQDTNVGDLVTFSSNLSQHEMNKDFMKKLFNIDQQ